MEFKNSAGSWASIQSTVFNLVGGTGSWTASSNNISNTNSGNVGIGTASPGAKLAVTSPTNGVRVNSWVDVNSSACGLAGIGQNVYLNQADNSYKWANTHGGIGGSLIELGTCSGSAYNDIVFLRASGTTGSIPTTANATAAMTESVRITSSGNVGIGTAYPVAKLNVVGGGLVVGSANPVANYWIWGDGYLNVYGPVQAARCRRSTTVLHRPERRRSRERTMEI